MEQVRTADSSLSPVEKEDRQAERLIHKRPAPSRKRRQKRGPKQDNRRRRMKVDDPDMKPPSESHRDMSLRSRSSALRAAVRIAVRPVLNDQLLRRYERAVDEFLDDARNSDDEMDLSDLMLKLEESDLGPGPAKKPLLRRLLDKLRAAASNEGMGPVSARTGAYHGVLDLRGNPTDPPGTGQRLYDSRYFNEESYDSILKFAKSLLSEDWLKHGWEGGADEARWRAALDLSIHLADGNLYQSRIDVDTYNLLLNRLAKLGQDSFSDTILPEKPKGNRSASAMKTSQAYQSIVRIASDLRQTDPTSALEILKNLRSLVSTDADSAPTLSEHIAEPASGPAQVQAQEQQAPAPEQTAADTVDFKSLSDDDFKKLKADLKSMSDKLFREDDVETFMEGFEDIISKIQQKTAGGLVQTVLLGDLVRLAASSPEARAVLAPLLITAAKKKGKKKGKGKKAPPFMKKEDAKKDDPKANKGPPKAAKGKKHKASISSEDTW